MKSGKIGKYRKSQLRSDYLGQNGIELYTNIIKTHINFDKLLMI